MILSEYDEQKHIENEKRWSWEEGREEGVELANHLIKLLLTDGRQEELHRSFEDKAFHLELMQEYGLIND